MFRALCLFAALLASTTSRAELGLHLQQHLGSPAPTGFESVVAPDGTGAPPGSGSVSEGKVLYEKFCASCHGLDGQIQGNAIAGGIGSLTTNRPYKTVGSYWPFATTVFDYINRAMPYGDEKSLSPDQVYAVTAYVLYLSSIVTVDMILNADNLADVEMPNKNGFETLPGFKPASPH